jgi:hypothetical protein
MSTTIKPTLGRIVWYRGEDSEFRAAIVVGVNGDFNVNLYVFGHYDLDKEIGAKDSVTHADPEQEPLCFPSWHWMPYQVEQAKKAEAKPDAMSAGSCSTAGQIIGAAGISPQHARFDALSMALRTPGVNGYHDVLAAAKAYQAHIEGEAAAPAQPAPGAAHAGYSTMQPHQQRVVDEHAELSSKIVKLEVFVGTELFQSLDGAEQERLRAQLDPMEAYRSILAARIHAFTAD